MRDRDRQKAPGPDDLASILEQHAAKLQEAAKELVELVATLRESEDNGE